MGNVCCEGPTDAGSVNRDTPQVTVFGPSQTPIIKNEFVQQRLKELRYKPLEIDDSKYKELEKRKPMKESHNKFVYSGTWKDDKPEGIGNIVFENGEYFQGQFKDGKAQGKGRYIFLTGDYYEGNVSDNQAEGEGKYVGESVQYQGEWKNSKPTKGSYRLKKTQKIVVMESENKGSIDWKNGNKYEGEVKNYAPNGAGKITFSDGSSYDGQWKDGIFQGYGTFTWPNGKVYKGHYVNGVKHGRGEFHYSANRRYEGDWKDGKQNGHGRLFQDNEIVYEGEFRNGLPTNSSSVSPSKDLEGSERPPQKLLYEQNRLGQSNEKRL